MNEQFTETPDTIYGRLLESVHMTGYTAGRACIGLELLLDGDDWMKVGPGFEYFDQFVESINLSEFKLAIEQRKGLAEKMALKGASHRKIAVALGVSRETINKDLKSGNLLPPDEGAFSNYLSDNDLQTEENVSGNLLPPTGKHSPVLSKSGSEAIGTVEKKIEIDTKRQQASDKKTAIIDGLRSTEAAPPTGTFDVIVLDPPWPMKIIEREVSPNQVELDYPTMTEEELGELRIPANNDCHMWLWTTHKFLPMALRLIPKWGFTYVCTFVWHKPGGFQPFGLPQYNCEFALYAHRGNPLFADTKAFPVCFNSPRGRHSEKPEEFFEMVKRVAPGQRISMFERKERDGFSIWGNEV